MGAVLLTAIRCGKEEKPKNTVGNNNYNAHHSECLLHTDKESLSAKGYENPDMVSTEYNNGTLHVTHHNLTVNCGIAQMDGGIIVTIERDGSTINIHESEDPNAPQANCICEVDNEFDIPNIDPGTYTLVFHSCYPDPLTVTVEL